MVFQAIQEVLPLYQYLALILQIHHCQNILLLFHIPIEEGDDLGAGAVVIRTEQAIADPASDALVRRPCDRVGIPPFQNDLCLSQRDCRLAAK